MKNRKELLCPIDKLATGIMYCFENAKQLIQDAKLLYSYGKYARAVTLAIIALEEYGKSDELLRLTTPIEPKELNAFIKDTLRDHHGKQITACSQEFIMAAKGKNIKKWVYIADKKQFLSREKENGLYVNMNEEFDFTSPIAITKNKAQAFISFVAGKIFEDWKSRTNYQYVLDYLKYAREGEIETLKELKEKNI